MAKSSSDRDGISSGTPTAIETDGLNLNSVGRPDTAPGSASSLGPDSGSLPESKGAYPDSARRSDVGVDAGRDLDIDLDQVQQQVEQEIAQLIGQGPHAPAGSGLTSVTNTTVVCALSGGVDSSVAAAFLVRAGFNVIGVTLQLWPEWLPADHEGGCCSLAAVEDARRVARRLGIPYYVFNMQEAFEDEVIRPFARTYLAGQTPNPCLLCNKRIKLGALLDKALELGAGYVATGHYARIAWNVERGRYTLRQGVDRAKDQSYALCLLGQEQLAHTVTPLGILTKPVTRKVAAALGLVTARKPESQEICFVPDNDYRRFIREYTGAQPSPGPVVNRQGQVLGEHRGLPFYTIGQRKGLNVASPRPLYVLEIDVAHNRLVVGERSQAECTELTAGDVNWVAIAGLPPEGMRVRARVRYRVEPAPAWVYPGERPDVVRTVFDRPQFAITPGQTVVWYDGDEVVGGGTILPAHT